MRTVYTPMAYLYGKKFVGPITDLILQLRDELYNQPYEEVDWNKARHLCLKVTDCSYKLFHVIIINSLDHQFLDGLAFAACMSL